MRFHTTAHVECATKEQAGQVFAERLGPDEDYGFPYSGLDCGPVRPVPECVEDVADAMFDALRGAGLDLPDTWAEDGAITWVVELPDGTEVYVDIKEKN